MVETISAKELLRYEGEENVMILDLRSGKEYREGHVPGAINVPGGRLNGARLNREKTLILYCDRGSRSLAVGRELDAAGYRVKSVVGGYLAYKNSGLAGNSSAYKD